MKSRLLSWAVIVLCSLGLAACTETTTNTNSNTDTARVAATPTPKATPKYSEEQAREERARAKENKETIGQSLDDAWIHSKIVAKLIGDTKTPERKINVDVVNGEVTLRGDVDTAEAKAEAEGVAKDTDGVKKVINQLKVVASTTKPSNANKSSKSKTTYE